LDQRLQGSVRGLHEQAARLEVVDEGLALLPGNAEGLSEVLE
jgi:hypothetical protein